MPLADIGERLQGALEIIIGGEQRLRDVRARARSDGDPTPARAFVDEPCRARRAFAVDDDLRDVVAQFNRQIETGVDRRIGSEVESRPANFPSLSIEGAHRPRRGPSRIRPRELGGQRSRLIVSAGKRRARPCRRSRPRPSGRSTPAVSKRRLPRRVRLRLRSTRYRSSVRERESARSPATPPRGPARREPAPANATDPRARICLAARCPCRPARGPRTATIRPDRSAAAARSRAKSIRLSQVRRRGKSVVDQNQKRARSGERDEAVPQRLSHRENDERADREPERQDRPRRARWRRLVRVRAR